MSQAAAARTSGLPAALGLALLGMSAGAQSARKCTSCPQSTVPSNPDR